MQQYTHYSITFEHSHAQWYTYIPAGHIVHSVCTPVENDPGAHGNSKAWSERGQAKPGGQDTQISLLTLL